MTRYFGGLDVGTSSMKAVLVTVNGQDCDVVWARSETYNEHGAPEREPETWHRIAHKLLREMMKIHQPEALGFSGQMHTLLVTGKDGDIVAPVRLWLDMDGFDALNQTPLNRGEWVKKTGNTPLPDFTLAKWLWAVNMDPALPSKTQRLYCAKDYLRHALDPSARFVTDRNEAAGMQCYDPVSGNWQADILDIAHLPAHSLPQTADASDIAGELNLATYVVSRTPAIPMVIGAGDQATAARAVGGYREGAVSVSLGTSGVLSFSLAKDRLPKSWSGDFHLFPFGFGDNYQVIGTIPALGPTLNWLKRVLHLTTGSFDQLAGHALLCDTNVQFLPYLSGSGAPEPNHQLSAGWLNMTLTSDDTDLCRAVFNGIALEFDYIIHQAQELGIPVKSLHFSGGGSQVQPLLKVIASVTGLPCYNATTPDASAAGAALLAADAIIPENHATLPMTPVHPVCVTPVSDSARQSWYQARQLATGTGYRDRHH
ncbi:FGGY family carbohydrate kinase [Parasalinivibrio latis]|uniref:FGGY family carbohydrate kinase n=1 Tax=Parasalinivibrio latis TaxID=2952610 RepID=UPI0030E4FED3